MQVSRRNPSCRCEGTNGRGASETPRLPGENRALLREASDGLSRRSRDRRGTRGGAPDTGGVYIIAVANDTRDRRRLPGPP
jgi:hypothetical protein